MTEENFIALFTEAIGADPGGISLDTPLNGVDTWDSVAYLAVMTMVDEQMNVVLPPESLVTSQTPREILEKARQG